MDLFEYQREKNSKNSLPLAAKMRPVKLEDFVGQEHIVGKNKLLYRAIKSDKVQSIVLYGPPGTGKTTLAQIIANSTKSNFVRLNATASGVKDIKAVIDDAKSLSGMTGRRTTLFIDEIHRFNKAQQDALLPHVEDGTIVLIGATTENPYFEVNKALISRSTVFALKSLTKETITELLFRAVYDEENGYGGLKIELDKQAAEFLADMANGDARAAYNALETAILTTDQNDDGVIVIDIFVAEECIQRRSVNYDKNGDSHYDVISAFIKSMRGSDPDAAVYYLGRMIYAGEDVRFIARRIVICAAEDVGNADPHALMVATTAAQAVDFIGFPEGRIILAQAAIYVACAPKSNAAICAIDSAMKDVENIQIKTIPPYLKDSSYSSAGELGHGIGYKYAHSYPGHYVKQQYLPDELVGKIYYEPSDNGVEKKIKDNLSRLRNF